MSRNSPVSLARAEKIVAECAYLRDASAPLIFARGDDNWRVTYDAGRTWVSIASIDEPASTLRERIAAAMSSPRLQMLDSESLPDAAADDLLASLGMDLDLPSEAADAATDGLVVPVVVLVSHRNGDVSMVFPFLEHPDASDEDDADGTLCVPHVIFEEDRPVTRQLRAIARRGVSGVDADADRADELDAVLAVVDGEDGQGLKQDLIVFSGLAAADTWLGEWLDIDDLSEVENASHVLFARVIGGTWHVRTVEPIKGSGALWDDEHPLICGVWSQVNELEDGEAHAESEGHLNELFLMCRPVPSNPFRGIEALDPTSDSRYTAADACQEVSDLSEYGAQHAETMEQALAFSQQALKGIQSETGQDREFFSSLSELAMSFPVLSGDEGALSVVETAFAEVSVLASGLMDELIGYGCDPIKELTDAIIDELRDAARTSALWCLARTVSYLRYSCEHSRSKRPVLLPKDLYEAAMRVLNELSHDESLQDENLRSVDMMMRHLRRARPERDSVSVPDGKRMKSLTGRALDDLCSLLSGVWHEAEYGAYASLPDAGWYSPNTGHTWMLQADDDLPRLLVMHGPDFPEPQISLMPPLAGPLMRSWEKRGCADEWSRIVERHTDDVAAMAVGNIYETCGNCGCPLPSTEALEYVPCPVCGEDVAVQALDQEGKAARAVAATFPDDQAAARAAVSLGPEFVEWRDGLAASTAWV